MPRLQERSQVRACLRRELNNPDRVVSLRIAQFSPPRALPHLKHFTFQVYIIHRQSAQLAGSKPGLRR
jgi:hypothetical protein